MGLHLQPMPRTGKAGGQKAEEWLLVAGRSREEMGSECTQRFLFGMMKMFYN